MCRWDALYWASVILIAVSKRTLIWLNWISCPLNYITEADFKVVNRNFNLIIVAAKQSVSRWQCALIKTCRETLKVVFRIVSRLSLKFHWIASDLKSFLSSHPSGRISFVNLLSLPAIGSALSSTTQFIIFHGNALMASSLNPQHKNLSRILVMVIPA